MDRRAENRVSGKQNKRLVWIEECLSILGELLERPIGHSSDAAQWEKQKGKYRKGWQEAGKRDSQVIE